MSAAERHGVQLGQLVLGIERESRGRLCPPLGLVNKQLQLLAGGRTREIRIGNGYEVNTALLAIHLYCD